MNNYTQLFWESVKKSFLIKESGQSIAAVDPKTPKTVGGQPAQASQKLSIAGGKKEIISDHIRKLAVSINKSLKFWRLIIHIFKTDIYSMVVPNI